MHFDKFLRGSRLIGRIKSIKFPVPNVAIKVAISGTIQANQSNVNPERNSIHTIVAVKHESIDQWYFTAFQNTRAVYIGQPQKATELTKEIEQLE